MAPDRKPTRLPWLLGFYCCFWRPNLLPRARPWAPHTPFWITSLWVALFVREKSSGQTKALLLLLHPEKWSPAAVVRSGCCDCRAGPAAREQLVGFGVSPWHTGETQWLGRVQVLVVFNERRWMWERRIRGRKCCHDHALVPKVSNLIERSTKPLLLQWGQPTRHHHCHTRRPPSAAHTPHEH